MATTTVTTSAEDSRYASYLEASATARARALHLIESGNVRGGKRMLAAALFWDAVVGGEAIKGAGNPDFVGTDHMPTDTQMASVGASVGRILTTLAS